jgi:hypothetical protein
VEHERCEVATKRKRFTNSPYVEERAGSKETIPAERSLYSRDERGVLPSWMDENHDGPPRIRVRSRGPKREHAPTVADEFVELVRAGAGGAPAIWNAARVALEDLRDHPKDPRAHAGGCEPERPDRCPWCKDAGEVLRYLGLLVNAIKNMKADPSSLWVAGIVAKHAFAAGVHAGHLDARPAEAAAREGRAVAGARPGTVTARQAKSQARSAEAHIIWNEERKKGAKLKKAAIDEATAKRMRRKHGKCSRSTVEKWRLSWKQANR